MANTKRTKALGEFAAADGKIDAVKAAELFFEDVVFNNEDEIAYDGKHHEMVGLQFNSDVLDRYPTVSAHYRAFGNAIREMAQFVEQNKQLMIPKTMFHKRLLALTRKQPITGITLLDLCAWHLLRVTEKDEAHYTVTVDRNLVKGLPACRLLAAEFVKTLREFNGKAGAFAVSVRMTGNNDILDAPVAGADEAFKTATVKVKEGESPYAGVLATVRAAKAASAPKAAPKKNAPKPKAAKPKAKARKKAAPVAAPNAWTARGKASYRAKWVRSR